ncbi:PKD domain-containing protein [Flagellimonas lutaonensis]|uniref:PKD domain-containing protein n=1 Tax=Flagellimonas lutaonensis TaxID=516051 RepID=A0A0D5YW66_9FLAO|nr:PKD domain-containing protein [Allomuricauda lutaonensis]AKA36093.1 PKD domain-containing protein [Allomuricauda lutaonensis]
MKGFYYIQFWVTIFIFTVFPTSNIHSQGFNSSALLGESLNNPTSLAFGPDGKLYVAQQDGTIHQYTVARDGAPAGSGTYSVTNTVVINHIKLNVLNHNDIGELDNNGSAVNGKRQVTGILAAGTAANPILYVTSSDPRIGGASSSNPSGELDRNLDTNSGILSRLTWNGNSWNQVDLVRGLPRCEENHASNGLDIFTKSGSTYLLLQQGGNTNKGAPSNNFGGIAETYLAGAILIINLTQLEGMAVYTDPRTGFDYVYDLPTLNDPTRTDITNTHPKFPYPSGHPMYNATIDIGDPFGGNNTRNQAIPEPGGPVQIFSPGWRNGYDVVVTEAGLVYSVDNGGNSTWGGVPLIYLSNGTLKGHHYTTTYDPGAGDYVTNDFHENGSSTVWDALHFIGSVNDANGTYYAGHPVPIRAFPALAEVISYNYNGSSWVEVSRDDFSSLLNGVSGYFNSSFNMSNFPNDTRQGEFLSANQSSSKVNIFDVVTSSTNGICEYTASNFNNAMKGDLLTASFNGKINRYQLNSSGTTLLVKDNNFFSGFGSVPLDVIAQGDSDVFPGTVWAATYSSGNITVFEPTDFVNCPQPGEGGYDPFADSDGDGFTNEDEVANGTNHCSGGSKPEDNDGDFVSDLMDADDDNDGIADVNDSFQWDADNGTTTNLPVDYPFWNNDPGTGFAGLGFTGWMTNGSTDYLDQYDEGNLSFGGAGGKATIDFTGNGDALGASNDQENGFQFGINVDSNSNPFTVHSKIETPFGGNPPVGTQSYGIQIGTGDQDNYLKLAASTGTSSSDSEHGFEVVLENGGLVTSNAYDAPGFLAANAMDLYISIDPSANTAQCFYSFDSGTTINALGGPLTLPSSFLDTNDNQGLAVGIISTSGGSGPDYTATWDFINVDEGTVGGESCIWNGLTDAGLGRFETRKEQVGDKLYIMGGWLTGLIASNTVEIYDMTNDTWSFGANMPINVTHMGSAVVGNDIWLIGGFVGNHPGTATGEVHIYNTITDSWSQGPALPSPIGSGAATYNNGKIHFFGGLLPDRQTDVGNHYVLDVNDIGAGWATAASLPNPRNHHGAASVNGFVYAIGGQFGHDSSPQYQNLLHAYNPSTDTWTNLAALPQNRSHFEPGTTVHDGKIIIVGGRGGPSIFFDEVSQYDPITNTWMELCQLPEKLVAPVAHSFGDRLIVSGGGVNSTSNLTTSTQWLQLESGNSGLTWNDKNENETYLGRHECGFVQAGDKFYLIGGRESDLVQYYDYSADIWTTVTDPAPLLFNHFQGIEYKGLIWVIAALKGDNFPNDTPTDYVWMFDPANQEWIQGTEIPSGRKRGSTGLALYNDKFYVVGGNTNGHDGGYVAWMDEYDPATGAWTTLPDAPHARDHFSISVIGNKLYAVGGRLSGGPGGVFSPYVPEVDVYDFTSQSWQTLPPSANIPTSRASAINAIYNGKLMIIGGSVQNELVYGMLTTDALQITEEFDPVTHTWTRLADTNYKRRATQAIVNGNGIFMTAGSDQLGGAQQKNMEYYGQDNPSGTPIVASQFSAPSSISVEQGSNADASLDVSGGNVGIFVRSMQISGTNASEFSIVSGELPNGGLLMPNSTHNFSVGFNGTTNGATATLTVEYGASSQEQIQLFGPLDVNTDWVDKNENENYTARHECSFVQSGDKFYLMGGRENSTTIDVYDYTSNSWSQLTNSAPEEFNHFQALEYHGLIWVIGAFRTNIFPSEIPADYVWAFDPSTNEWIQGPEIPSGRKRGSSALALHNGKFYIMGGNTDGHDGGYVAWFDEYDPATGTWTTLTDAPRARDHFHATVIDGKLYAAGGRLSGGAGGTFSPTIPEVDVYDFASATWSTLPSAQNIPTQRAAAATVKFNDRLIVIGGEAAGTGAMAVTEEYDPVAQSWRTLSDMNHARHGTQAIVSGSGIFILAGSPNLGNGNQKNMEYLGTDNPQGVPLVTSTLSAPTSMGIVENSSADITLNVSGGNTGVVVTSMSITGPDASDFNIVSGELTNGLLVPLSSHNVTVVLTGTGANRNAVLTINYGVSSSVTVDLVSIVPSTDGVISFTLIDADTDNDLFNLFDGQQIDISSLPTSNLNVRGNTEPPTVGSVFFQLSGTTSNTRNENGAPYALFGDSAGDYFPGSLPEGNYSLTATAYNGPNQSGGILGQPFIVNFSINQTGGGNLPPTAIASANPESGNAPLSVDFAGSGSTDDMGVTSYFWDFKDGNTSTDADPTHIFTSNGTYMVEFTVTDGGGLIDTTTLPISVSPVGQGTELWLEAECATVGANWSTVSDGSASNGEYLLPPAGNNWNSPSSDTDDWVTFTFNASQGTYSIYGLVSTPSGSNDSFWIRANGGTWVKWNSIPGGTAFSWHQVWDNDNNNTVVAFDLVDGANTIDVTNREQGTGLDKLYVTDTANVPAGLGGADPNCTVTPQPPVANAGADQTVTLPTSSVTLNGSGTDPDGGVITGYQWTQQSGPNTAALSGDDTPDLTASGLVEGSYVFRLTVTDDESDTGFDEATVVVNAAGQGTELWLEAECATVGANWSTVSDGSASNGEYLLPPAGNNWNSPSSDTDDWVTFTFNASQGTYSIYGLVSTPSGSNDSFWIRANGGTWVKWNSIPGGTAFSWHQVWDNDNNNTVVAFDLVDGANTIDVTNREQGTGLDKLYVTDTANVPAGLGGADPNCTVTPQPPVANAGADQTVTLPTSSVTLNGSGTDPDGGVITGYQWTQQSGPNTAALSGDDTPDLTASGLVEGSYVFRLTVTDDESDTGFDEATVVVNAAGQGTELWLEAECATVGANWSTVSDGSASNGEYLLPPAGNNWNSPSSDTDDWVTFTFNASQGTYSIYGLVSTPSGSNDSFWIRANGGTWVKWNSIPGGTAFSWHQVWDNDNNNTVVAFDLVDGANTIDVTNREQGTGLDKLYVTDTANVPAGLGGADPNCTVTPQPPVANAGADQTVTLPTSSVTLNGSGTDPDGGVITGYQWTQQSGPNTAALSGDDTPDLTASGLVEGSYVFRLTVTDDESDTGFDEATVVVSASGGNLPPNVNNPGDQNDNESDAISLQINATDQSSNLTYSASNLPSNLSINSNTGLISGTLSQGQPSGAFLEENGLVIIEAESGTLEPAWSLTNLDNETGIIAGSNHFNDQNGGTIPYEITITTPGVYRFIWNSFYSGNSASDENDNWLRFPNDDDVWFLGYKNGPFTESAIIAAAQAGAANVVFPKGSSREGQGGTLNGSGGNGYFKIYKSSGGSEQYTWQSFTGDSQGFAVFVWFVNPGTYTMEISERSAGHAIDRVALYRVTASYTDAQLDAAPESPSSGGSQGAAANSPYNVMVTVTDDGVPQESTTIQFDWIVGTGGGNPNTQSVESFTLINADTDSDLFEITDGMQIQESTIQGLGLNVRANTNPTIVGSVSLSLTGPVSNTRPENGAPYALFGDSGGDYFAATFSVGNYTLSATPYPNPSLGGTPGQPLTVQFAIVAGGTARLPNSGLGEDGIEILLSPNPTSYLVDVVSTPRAAIEKVYIFDVAGRLVKSIDIDSQSTFDGQFSFDVLGIEDGIYVVQMWSAKTQKVSEHKLIIRK